MSASTSPALESLRRQLEGRWEHIERARERYTRLAQQLSSFRWRSALRGQPEPLKETREHEAELTEVLAYVEQRARQEQWPREHAGLRVLQALRTQRVKLEALAHKRLAQATLQNGASFEEALSGLEALTLALPPRGSSSSEHHPPAPSLQPAGSWFQENRFRLGIAGGAALVYSSAIWGPRWDPFPDHPLAYAGYALLAWTSMSYTKNRGLTVLPGLLFSLLFYPLLAFFPLILAFMWGSLKPRQQ